MEHGVLASTGLCPNCEEAEQTIASRYCAKCGQKNTPLGLSFGALLHDAFEDFFHLDGKVPQTLLRLVRSPGALTEDFIRGRRTRYLGPFRIFLVCSLIYAVAYTIYGLRISPEAQGKNFVASDLTFWRNPWVAWRELYSGTLGRCVYALTPPALAAQIRQLDPNAAALWLRSQLPRFDLLLYLFCVDSNRVATRAETAINRTRIEGEKECLILIAMR